MSRPDLGAHPASYLMSTGGEEVGQEPFLAKVKNAYLHTPISLHNVVCS